MSCTCGQLDILYNFISPITGRILADPNYVLVGNKDGIAIPSPILIDVRLDLIALRKRYNSLVKGDIVIGHPNNELPNAQVLFNLTNGFLITTDGILSTNTMIPIEALPDLPYQNIWIGDITNRPVPQQRIDLKNLPSFRSLNPLSNFGLYGLYTGQGIGFNNPFEIAQPTITQRLNMSNMPTLTRGKMWIGKINYIPPVIIPKATFPWLEVIGSLNWNSPGLPPGPGDAVPTEIGLNPGELFIGDPSKPGEITATTVLFPDNLPNLRYNYIWRGNVNNRPVEVNDLTILEGSFDALKIRVDQIEFVKLPIIDADLVAIHLDLVKINLALAALEFTVNTILVPTVAGISGTITLVILPALSGLSSRITSVENRTLDQIPVAANVVNLNNQRIGNLADPTTPLSAVNLQTMQAAIAAAIGGTITSVTGTANQITANTVSGAVTLSLPSDVIISTSLSAGNLELIGNSLISTNTNGNILLNPNGTGNVDVNNHKIINLANPTTSLDAVNLQTLNTAIAGTISSVTGTANQITANTVSGAVTLSLPVDVIITTSLAAGNLKLIANSLISTNTNGNILLNPNGTGNIDVNNHKIINLANPTTSLDAVNLQTLNTAIAGTISSVSGTANQITASTVSGAVTLSLPSAVIITTSLTAGNLELTGNSLISTNTNGNVLLDPNGTGNVDVNNSRILNVSDPVGVLDAVNLQTLNAAVGAGVINSVTGTANQITASTVSGAVTLSLPATVIVTTSVAAANIEINTNVIQSNNTNGDISIKPNGSGNVLLIPTGTGLVGVKGTPSYSLDVFGTTRTQRLLGSTGVTITAGVTGVTGTGRTTSNDGSEIGGSITLNTGTGISAPGTTNPLLTVTFATAMPSGAYCVVITPGSLTAAGLPLYIIRSTTSAFTIRCTTQLTNSTTYVFNYHVIGN